METIKLGIIGHVGHVGHGKTTLSRALQKFGRGRGFSPEELGVRGITLEAKHPEHFSSAVEEKDIVR